MDELTPKQIVCELDKYIIGQAKAKRAVAIALRNRYRRMLLPQDISEEVTPKNIMMIGPTGVGKTEIARRLAKLVNAPFIKVEATKFTEVGYVGRDVDSIIRDLVEASIRLVKEEKTNEVSAAAKFSADQRLADLLIPGSKKQPKSQGIPLASIFGNVPEPEKSESSEEKAARLSTREAILKQLRDGLLENQIIEIEVEESPSAGMDLSGMGIDFNISDVFGNLIPKKKKIRKLTVAEARRVIEQEEAEKMIDSDEVNREALKRAENHGIVFIDEIDKIAGRQSMGGGPDVSREGVQRDILPIIEGSTVNTKYGPVKTDHMLFIAAGAFHVAKVEDLIPELQGRFPINVNLDSLSANDFARILTEPENAQTKQYEALLGTENVDIEFTPDGIKAIADYAFEANENGENLGARRLHTIIENLLEEISFDADSIKDKIVVNADFVNSRLKSSFDHESLRRYIL